MVLIFSLLNHKILPSTNPYISLYFILLKFETKAGGNIFRYSCTLAGVQRCKINMSEQRTHAKNKTTCQLDVEKKNNNDENILQRTLGVSIKSSQKHGEIAFLSPSFFIII